MNGEVNGKIGDAGMCYGAVSGNRMVSKSNTVGNGRLGKTGTDSREGRLGRMEWN